MRRFVGHMIAFFSAVLLLVTFSASAQDVTQQQNRKAQLEKEIKILDGQIAGIKEQSSSATTRLELLRQNITKRRALVAESEKIIRALNDAIKAMDGDIMDLQQEVDTLVYYYEKLVSSAYKYRDAHVWYLYVFASDNIGQAFRRAAYLRSISEQLRDSAKDIKEKKAELELQMAALDTLRQEALAVKEARVKELEDLRADEREAERLVQQLKKERKKIESQIAAKKKEVKALNKEIQKKIEEAKRKAASSKKEDPQDIKLSGQFESNKGKLPWPVSGPVVGKFGRRFHPVHKNLELPANEGIDIAVENGEAVKAVFDGTVLDIFVMPSYGQCVMVQHGTSYFTFYCRMDKINVKKGDKVKTGQQLGTVGVINGTAQMHFELWKDKTPQNPSNWLREK